MWNELNGTVGYTGGTDGTVTLPAGARLIKIYAHSTDGGSFTIFNGASVPVIADTSVDFIYQHQLWVAFNNTRTAGSQDIVFTGTDSYYVEWVKSGNT